MCKKIIAILLVTVLFLCCTSCDSDESGVTIQEPTKVAVGSDQLSLHAAQDYATNNGYELVEYDSRDGAVVSVENGVNDYVVLNSDEITDEYLSGVDLELLEVTEFKVEYCAYFNNKSTVLQQELNKVIKAMNDDGTFDAINQAHRAGEEYTPQACAAEKKLTILCMPVFDNRFYYDDAGKLKGVELDIINEMCARLNVSAEIKIYSDLPTMFSALEKGEGDVIISSLSYTEERATQFLCSDVYAQTLFGVYKSTT